MSSRHTKALAGYVPRIQTTDGAVVSGPAVDLHDGWNLVRWNAQDPVVLVFADTSPPSFELDPGFPEEIHPADLAFGLTVIGFVVDRVGSMTARHQLVTNFDELSPGEDGVVRLRFEVRDDGGNTTNVMLPLRVTDTAIRRGSNRLYYRQGVYSPTAVPERTVARLQ